MIKRTPDEWLQYAHDHIDEILADAIRWQEHITEEWAEDEWMKDNPVDWYMDCFSEARKTAARLIPAIAAMRTAKELRDARARPQPVREVRATAGWPPIAIPGRPGWHRHLINGQQVDLPDDAQSEAA